jgi:hypothetical protein
MVNAEFVKWATGFSGCDGGDTGTPQSPSIWFCGIEWGGGHSADEQKLRDIFSEDVAVPAEGYTDYDGTPAWNANLAYIFNWQAMKLLAAIDGAHFSTYKSFAEKIRPFVKDERGYYKMNLYPLAFRNTSHELWKDGFAKATGIQNKQNYLEWIRAYRFPVMKAWVDTYVPRLIVCVGITYLSDFRSAFIDNGLELNHETIDERELNWVVNKNGTIVVVIPFMVNRNGLTRNVSIQKFGERIRELLMRP